MFLGLILFVSLSRGAHFRCLHHKGIFLLPTAICIVDVLFHKAGQSLHALFVTLCPLRILNEGCICPYHAPPVPAAHRKHLEGGDLF